jgi:hypothetical protein
LFKVRRSRQPEIKQQETRSIPSRFSLDRDRHALQ